MDPVTLHISTGAAAPILFGLVCLGLLLHDALRPKSLVRIRHLWIAPGRVVRVVHAPDGGYVLIGFSDGAELAVPVRPDESSERLRDAVGRAIRKRKDLKD